MGGRERSVTGFTRSSLIRTHNLLQGESGRPDGPRMNRTAFLFMLLLAGCSDAKRPPQAVNEMIESPLRNTVISSFDTYPPKPIANPDGDLVSSLPVLPYRPPAWPSSENRQQIAGHQGMSLRTRLLTFVPGDARQASASMTRGAIYRGRQQKGPN